MAYSSRKPRLPARRGYGDFRPTAPRFNPNSYGPRQPTYVGVGAQPPVPRGTPPHTPLGGRVPGPPVTPDYLGQASQSALAQIDPMLQYLTQKYGRQMAATQAGMSNVTGQYAAELGRLGGLVGPMFAEAQAPIRATSQGLNAQYTAGGKQSAATESAALAAAHLPQGAAGPDATPGALEQGGKGAGGAAGAIGQALIDSLAAAQKAAMTYAGKLPGFAQAEGQQQIQQALAGLSAELADRLAETTAQLPQLTYQIYNNLLDRAQHDKEWAFQLKQYADQQAAKRASITGPQAPTNQGRLGYWQGVAADRTKSSGYEWMGTTTGIRPVDADPRKPGIQPSYTLQGAAAARAGIKTRAQINQGQQKINETKRHNRQTETTSQQNADTAAQREQQRHAEAVRRLQIAQRNAKTAQDRAAIAARRATEQRRHNKAMEGIARSKKKTAGGSSSSPSGTIRKKPQ